MLKYLIHFIVIGFLGHAMHALAAVPISVTLQAASPSLANHGTGYANYVVSLHPSVPGALSLSLKGGVPQGAVLQTSGSAPCPGVARLCGATFTLNRGESCCLAFQLQANQMAPGDNFFAPLVGTTPATYQGQAAVYSLRVNNTAALYAAGENGFVYYSSDAGETWTPSTSLGASVNSIFVTEQTVYVIANNMVKFSTNGGYTWASLPVLTSGTPNQVFVISGGTQANDIVYVTASPDIVSYYQNGVWHDSSSTPQGNPLTGIYVIRGVSLALNQLWVGDAAGNVLYSLNNGSTWNAYTTPPDGTPIHNVFVTPNQVFVNTFDEYVYTNTSFTGGGSWTTYAQTVFSLFVSADGSNVDAGTQGGFMYSLSTGSPIGFVTYTPLNGIYRLG